MAEGSSSSMLLGSSLSGSSARSSPVPRTTPTRTMSASPTPTPSPSPPRTTGQMTISPSASARTASPVHESGASAYSYSSAPSGQSHRTPTPVSPQYTFGGHTPLSPQSFASGTTAAGIVPNPLAVPEVDELSTVLEQGSEIDLGSPSPEPQDPVEQQLDAGDAGDSGLASTSSHSYAPQRAGSPDSVDSATSIARTPTSRSQRSNHSSWQTHQSPAASTAAINIAHKQRVSQAPPLPDKPYAAPPSALNRPLTPTAATSLLAAAASSLATPTMSASRLSTSTMASSMRRKSRGGAKSPLGDDIRDMSPVALLPPGVVYTPSPGPSAAVELKAAIDAGAAPPRYAFLDQDPTEADENSPPTGGIMTYSGGDRRVSSTSALAQGSSPHSSNSQRKHLSFQSQHSEAFGYQSYQTSSSMAEMGDSVSSSNITKPDRAATRMSAQSFRDQWSSFAGGPAPAWGKRESNRFSMKSYKSAKSNKSIRGKRKSAGLHGNGDGAGSGGSMDDWIDDDDADLIALVRRAAVLERLLRHGKRASNFNANPRMVQRYSHWSVASTSLSNGPSRMGTSRSRSGSPEKRSQTPPRRSGSSATTHRSKRSVTSSLRHKFQRRLGIRAGGREFTEIGSDDGFGLDADTTEPDMTVEGLEDDNSTPIRTPQTPIRRAFSTSFSRHERATPPPGAGAGIIVFPELAAIPPLEPPRHDGEVCAQACLPPSVAVPYTPLQLPPEAKRQSRSTKNSKHSRNPSGGSEAGGGGGGGGNGGGGLPQRSLHSLKNLRHAFDEKAGGGFSDNRVSVQGGTVLFGDVPTCDQRLGFRRARKFRILAAIACFIGIALIVGLLAGLLTRRNRSS